MPHRREHILAALLVLVVLVAATAGCSGSTEEDAGEGGPASAEPSTTARADADLVPPVATAPVDRALLEEAREEVAPIVTELALGEDVEDCVVHRTASDGGVAVGVATGDRDTWGPVLDVVRDCAHAVVAAPAFAAEQQRAAGGTLHPRQLACLRDGYTDLGPEVAEELAAAAVRGADEPPEGSAELREVLASCGVGGDR